MALNLCGSASEEGEENGEAPRFYVLAEAPVGRGRGGVGGVGSLVPCFDAGASRSRPAGAG